MKFHGTENAEDMSGTTALVSYISQGQYFLLFPSAIELLPLTCPLQGKLFVANCGDCKALLLSVDSSGFAALIISFDFIRLSLCLGRWTASSLSAAHKPDADVERARIEAAGGSVANNRVDGILAVSV